MPQAGSSVFSLFSLIELHLASLPLASSYNRVAVSSVFWAQKIIFGPNAWGPVKPLDLPRVACYNSLFFALMPRRHKSLRPQQNPCVPRHSFPLRAVFVQTSVSTPEVRRSVGVEPCRASNTLESSLKLFCQCCAGWPGLGPGSSPPVESLGKQQPLRESLVTLSCQGPCEQKPSLANCRFHTLAPGFLEGFSVRHLSICAVSPVVPDDPQKELVVRRP